MYTSYFESVDIWKPIRNKYDSDGIMVDIYGKEDIANLTLLRIPMELRGKGLAKKIMNEITNLADSHGVIIGLTPTNEFGSSKSRLVSFYKSFGFVDNKGKNKDYRINQSMIRFPKN